MSKDNYDEYADAKRSGRLKEEPVVAPPEPGTVIIEPRDSQPEPMKISKWIYRALIAAAIGFVTYKGYNSGLSEVLKEEIKPPVEIEKPEPPPPIAKTNIVYKDRIVYKDKFVFKDKIVFRDKFIFKKDLKCQQDLALMKLGLNRDKYWIDKFYNTPPSKREWKRVLTF